jgi:4-amino-4-deoxy-L-arabinose transferase-like glycosyltransferase
LKESKPSQPASRGAGLWLLALTLSSAAVKALAAWLSRALVFDEYLYCLQALALIHEGSLPTIFPLTPALTAGALFMLGGGKAGFLALNVALGSLLTLPAYQLARRLLDDEASLAAAATVAFNPILIWCSAHVLTEPLFTILASYFILLALSADRRREALLAGFIAGLAYLCRYPAILLAAVAALHLASSRRAAEAALLAASFTAVVASWQAAALALTGQAFQTERYSIFMSLGPPPPLSLEALPPMASRAFIGLSIAFLPLVPLAAHLKLDARGGRKLLLAAASTWLLVHLGYYAYQSFSSYAAQGYVVAAERVARWSAPITPLAAAALMSGRRSRSLPLATLASALLGSAIGLYLVEYTNQHAMLQLTWEEFLRGGGWP